MRTNQNQLNCLEPLSILEFVNNSAKQFVDFYLVYFDPSAGFFIQQITKTWGGGLSNATNLFERFLHSKDFEIYTRDSLLKLDKYREVELTQKFKDILNMDQTYKDTMSQLEPNIRQAYSEINELVQNFQKYIEIYNFSTNLKIILIRWSSKRRPHRRLESSLTSSVPTSKQSTRWTKRSNTGSSAQSLRR